MVTTFREIADVSRSSPARPGGTTGRRRLGTKAGEIPQILTKDIEVRETEASI